MSLPRPNLENNSPPQTGPISASKSQEASGAHGQKQTLLWVARRGRRTDPPLAAITGSRHLVATAWSLHREVPVSSSLPPQGASLGSCQAGCVGKWSPPHSANFPPSFSVKYFSSPMRPVPLAGSIPKAALLCSVVCFTPAPRQM